MNFKIYTLYKPKPTEIDAINEYTKRLSSYCKITLIQIKHIKHLSKTLNNTSYIIKIAINVDTISSEDFAKKIDTFGNSGKSQISIVVTDNNIKYNECLSLSTLSLSKGVSLVVLYEQIYRAYRIINNHTYHK